MTRVERWIAAPRMRVYDALVDAEAVARWRFPEGMRCTVHEFDVREGGQVRVSLTYDGGGTGKTSAKTDTYRGRFTEILPGERIVEVDEFETDDPAFAGEMTMTIALADAGEGTDVLATHDGVPEGIRPEDNEAGFRMALERLAALVE